MRTVKMSVSGRVQGVGFRYLTKLAADEQQITGSVKNEENGDVTIIAQGSQQQLAFFISTVKASPSSMGNVRALEIEELDNATHYTSFDVLY